VSPSPSRSSGVRRCCRTGPPSADPEFRLDLNPGWLGSSFVARNSSWSHDPAWGQRGGWHGDDSLGACHAPRSLEMVLVNRWDLMQPGTQAQRLQPSRTWTRFITSVLSSIAEPERLVSCGGMSASWPRIGMLSPSRESDLQLREPHPASLHAGGNAPGCLTKKEGHQISQCGDSGSSPEARVAAGHVIQGQPRRGVVRDPDDMSCSWRRPARPRGPSSGPDVRGTEAISM
jgi:hypothetical protein